MMKKILMLSAAVLVFQALPAMAQEGQAGKGDRAEKMFSKQDLNGDGVLTEEEFLSKAREHFAMMDADKNGQVTREESQAAFEKMKAKWKERKEKMNKEGAAPPPPAQETPAE